MSEDNPLDVAILELRDADLAREGAVRLVEDVLRRDFDALAQVLAREEEVERGRRDDDFGVGVAFGVVEVADEVFDGGDGAIPARFLVLVVVLGVVLAIGPVGEEGAGDGERYILKLPPTKNLRAMIAVLKVFDLDISLVEEDSQ